MKTINDLPVKVLAHILSFVSSYIDIVFEFRLLNLRWNEAVKHRLSAVKYIVQPFPDDYKAPMYAETMFSIPYFNSIEHSYFKRFENFDYTEYFISLMEMLPCIKAVQMDVPWDLRKQNKIFSYFNSRPTLIALGLRFGMGSLTIQPEGVQDVKLKNITMLSAEKATIHRVLKEFIERFFPDNHEFQQFWENDGAHVDFMFQKMPKMRKLYHAILWFEPPVMPSHKCNLEIFGVLNNHYCILKYLSKVTSLCSRLTSIHIALSKIYGDESMTNFEQFNQVENLVIEDSEKWESWSYAEKILQMYPMVKNLSIKYSSDLSQDKILRIFQWMPNLSILHLVYRGNPWDEENPWAINVDHLVSFYKQLHGRFIKICVEPRPRSNRWGFYPSGPKGLNRQIFKNGFDFMEHIFYCDDKKQPHILLE